MAKLFEPAATKRGASWDLEGELRASKRTGILNPPAPERTEVEHNHEGSSMMPNQHELEQRRNEIDDLCENQHQEGVRSETRTEESNAQDVQTLIPGVSVQVGHEPDGYTQNPQTKKFIGSVEQQVGKSNYRTRSSNHEVERTQA